MSPFFFRFKEFLVVPKSGQISILSLRKSPMNIAVTSPSVLKTLAGPESLRNWATFLDIFVATFADIKNTKGGMCIHFLALAHYFQHIFSSYLGSAVDCAELTVLPISCPSND